MQVYHPKKDHCPSTMNIYEVSLITRMYDKKVYIISINLQIIFYSLKRVLSSQSSLSVEYTGLLVKLKVVIGIDMQWPNDRTRAIATILNILSYLLKLTRQALL